MSLPKDPRLLQSVVNTYLRDRYGSLEALADDLEEDREEIERILGSVGLVYDPGENQFR